MRVTTVPRIAVAGIVGGALGAAANAAVLALFDFQGALINAIHFLAIVDRVVWGAGFGIVFAAVFPLLPRHFSVQVLFLWLLQLALTVTVFFPINDVPFTISALARAAGSGVAFAVACVFVVRQSLGLALPLVPMARPASDFNDNPAGA